MTALQMAATDHSAALLEIARNLSEYHREHEKYYSAVPLADAVVLQRQSRTLLALAERWSESVPAPSPLASPYAGAPDLNDPRAIETSGVLFMEGQAEPAEIAHMKAELERMAADGEQIGAWLATAMESAWSMAEGLLAIPELADLLGERHRIIANDWQAAETARLVARHLRRAVALLARVDFTPAALRADLADGRRAPHYLSSAAELLNHAADLAALSAVLTHDNERRWRVFHDRVAHLTASG